MSNTTLTADVIAKEAVMVLENNCVMGGLVYRGYEEEFTKSVNGYKIGETLSVKRPTDFTVRDGAVAAVQDVTEGKFTITIDKQKGIDFRFSGSELTLQIGELSERVIKPAMVQLANQIDRDVMALYKDVWNWVGTPGTAVGGFDDFSKAPERLDLGAVPQDDRYAVMNPSDQWGMLASQTSLYMQDVAKDAYRRGKLGMIANIDTYSSQNTPTHTGGSRDNTTPVTNGTAAANSTTWAASKDTGTMSLICDGFDATATITKGDVFTISGIKAVNPVTKATLAHDQQFVVKEDATCVGGAVTLTISPPIITSGAFQTVSAAPDDGTTITFHDSTASTARRQNLVFHKNAFALVMVPMVRQPGAVDQSRRSYKGFNVRVIPYYDGTNDVSNWRLDVLYGVKTIDARLATRLSGT